MESAKFREDYLLKIRGPEQFRSSSVLYSNEFDAMSTLAPLILLVLTNVFGAVSILISISILRKGRTQKQLTTYSNAHTKEENGPTLHLPEGVTLPHKTIKPW